MTRADRPDVDDPIAAIAALFLEHINERARRLGARRRAGLRRPRRRRRGQSVVDLDRDGVDIDRRRRRRRRTRVRVAFPEPVDDGLQLQALRRRPRPRRPAARSARTSSTPLERRGRRAGGDPHVHHDASCATEPITRGVRQITFGGGDLGDVRAARPPTSSCTCWRRRPGGTELTIDASVHVGAVRRDAARASSRSAPTTRCGGGGPTPHELDMLFVLHGVERRHDRAGGGAGRRAPGPATRSPCGGRGRRSRRRPAPTGTCSSPTTPGCPAVAAIIESLPAGTPVDVVAEVDTEADRQPLPERRRRRACTWCYRRGAPRRARRPRSSTPSGRWPGPPGRRTPGAAPRAGASPPCAATSATSGGCRRDAVSMTGYWRHALHARARQRS